MILEIVKTKIKSLRTKFNTFSFYRYMRDPLNQLDRTKKVIIILLLVLFILISLRVVTEQNKNVLKRRNSQPIAQDSILRYIPDAERVPWDIEVEEEEIVGNELIQNQYFNIQFSNFLDKYVVSVKSGDVYNFEDIKARVFVEVKKYSDVEDGIPESKLLIIDERSLYTEEGALLEQNVPFTE